MLLWGYSRGPSRCAQAKEWKQGLWHKKGADFLLHILKNSESNAELKDLDVVSLVIELIQVTKAPKMSHQTLTELLVGLTPA